MSFIGKVTSFLDFGAVKINPFPKPVPCTTNQTFCQPTEQTDDIALQFEVSESEELITNGDFQPPTGVNIWIFTGWTRILGAGNFFAQQIATSVNSLSQIGILTTGDHYRVTIKVSNYSGGTLRVGGGTGSAINNQVFAIRSNGTFTSYFQYFQPAGGGDFIIKSDQSPTAKGIQVDNVSVVKISDTSDYDIEIINQETGVVIDTVPVAKMSLTKNIITVDFNWANDVTVTNGCRQIQIIDNTNLLEDDFSVNQGWTLTGSISFPGTIMLYTAFLLTQKAFILGVFVVGKSYEFTMITSSMAGATVTIKCGETIGTARSTNNTFIETLTCTVSGTLTLEFSGPIFTTAGVDNLIIKQVSNIAGRSECYDLQDNHDCTLYFKWSNIESWGGFNYSATTGDADLGITPFEHRLRVEAKFRGTKYPSSKLIGENSAGTKSVDYSSLRKVNILDVHRAPDYIHDALAAMFVQDIRTIEDVSYILEDEYEASAPNDSVVLFKDLMTSRSELEKTEQPNLINRTV